jgi:NAD-dependent DNA ligase
MRVILSPIDVSGLFRSSCSVVTDLNDDSSKVEKVKSLGIPIILRDNSVFVDPTKAQVSSVPIMTIVSPQQPMVSPVSKKTSSGNTNMVGKTFIFTGFHDKDLEVYIVRMGGFTKTIVSKKTDYLVVTDKHGILVHDANGNEYQKNKEYIAIAKTYRAIHFEIEQSQDNKKDDTLPV